MNSVNIAKVLFIMWNLVLAAVLTYAAEALVLLFKVPMDTALLVMLLGSMGTCAFIAIGIGLLDLYIVLHGWDAVVKIIEEKRTARRNV